MPSKPKADEDPNSDHLTREGSAVIRLLIRHDEDEAENDAFYIDATSSSQIDLSAGRGVNGTPLIVIEDDDEQKVTVKRNTSSTVYEGDSGDDVPTFTVAADPPRLDLPLEVRLDMVDIPEETTVSSAQISLSKSSMRLNEGSTGNSDTVTLHLPASDGNRSNDNYALNASVNVYSISSGGYRTIEVASHPIEVIDRHKLPEVEVIEICLLYTSPSPRDS